jgi:glycosyltransferase involved in cell wall biosynthesis
MAGPTDRSPDQAAAAPLQTVEVLDAVRSALPMAPGGQRTDTPYACRAADRLRTITGDGATWLCEYATTCDTTERGDVGAALAAGKLALPHCRRCAEWVADDLAKAAPLVRDYGHLQGIGLGPSDRAPSLLVVEGIRDGAALLELVEAHIGTPTTLAIANAEALAPHELERVLELAAAPTAAARLQLRFVGWNEAIAARIAVLPMYAAEFAVRTLAEAPPAGAPLANATVRFVLTPDNWFDFEDVARACAARDVGIDLRILDRGGAVPLEALDVDDLTMVKAVVTSLWDRCGGEARPKSIADGAFDQLCQELRALLRRKIEATLANGQGVSTPLQLPPLAHPWNQDHARCDWWWRAMLGHGHLQTVSTWTIHSTSGEAGAAAAADAPWLRQLVQRIAAEKRPAELLELLRELYGEDKVRKARIREDQLFCKDFDVSPFGGPWAEQLGLLHDKVRRRPFAVGKPQKPKRGAKADLTVLIPSFRHGQYIEETLRSVLAQSYPNIRIVVADDCSTDDTVERARSIDDPRLEVRVNETNLGLGNSVLKALESIDTPYVALLNSDDLFHPDRLARCREVLAGDASAQLVTTGMFLVDGNGGQLTPTNASLVVDGRQVYDWVHWYDRAKLAENVPQERLFQALLERNFLVTSSNLVARTEWLRGQARALRSLKYCLDWQLFLEAALEGSLRHVHEPLLAYRLHATNTVWFREGRRWSYYLEVNRVAAEALRRYAASDAAGTEGRIEHLTEAIAEHLLTNSETDGLALFLHAAFDAIELDALAQRSPRVQELVQKLNGHAERLREAAAQRDAQDPASSRQDRELRRLLGDLAQEQVQRERSRHQWLRGYAESLEARLKECWEGRKQLEDVKRATSEERDQARRIGEQLRGELGQSHQRIGELEAERNAAWGARDAAKNDAAAAKLDLERMRGDLQTLREDLQATRTDLAVARRDLVLGREDLAASRGEIAAVRADLDGARQALATGQIETDAARADATALRNDLATARTAAAEAAKLAAEHVRAVEAALVDERARAKATSDAAQQAAETERARFTAELQTAAAELTALRAELVASRQDLERKRGSIDAAEDLRRHLVAELAIARSERDDRERQQQVLAVALAEEQAGLRAKIAEIQALEVAERQLQTHLAETHARLHATEGENVGLTAQLASQRTALDATREALERTTGEVASLRESLKKSESKSEELARTKSALESQRTDLAQKLARLQETHDGLLKSREFRSGNFLWNKLPLAYMSRRGKKWYRRILDAKNRCMMVGSRLLGRKKQVQGTAVVTACWQWPIYSHTFVYQEMIALTQMGLDVRLFHWDLGDTGQLHAAFKYLDEHRTLIQPIWENHLRDKEHFDKTKPGKLRSFLERVAKITGRSVDDLEKEPLVLQGCTFARMAELAGAKYLHSYFFYDQSFMAMQAAWLLDLPRGVSCYADHMLDDYPFKLVALHVELADVIIATSARIKRELSHISGGKFDDKIVVKPNGVDGARFPGVERGPRAKGDAFEVVSVSRIEPKKGLTHLVEAVGMLRDRGHKVIAHIVGSKDPHSKGSLEYAAEFEAKIAELGLQEQIILHGMMKQEQLTPILQRCRAFVAPYVEVSSGDKDGIPTAMLEALASKLPVVTTDSGSILEVVDDGVEGIVTKQRDSKGFADALQRLIEDQALEQRMAKAARARFDKDFDIRVTEKRLHARVREFLARKPAVR